MIILIVLYHIKFSDWNMFELLSNNLMTPVKNLYFIDGNEFVINSKEYKNKVNM